MTSQHDKPKRWRPWRFSLRALLILTFGAGCVCAGWLERQREYDRAEAAHQQEWMEEEARWWSAHGKQLPRISPSADDTQNDDPFADPFD
ncbi:MAG: hypothetical protein H8E66_11405 [Planctomycetes bacterium]|nr:hypothetical protein [Planctomycetota bacterium]